ncbi:MAG: DUF975 family protein [Lachnospiraceae bacterium]|nr:DUF975 family protein [Lachnospiraceae bacterium]
MKKPIREIKFNARNRLEYNYPRLAGGCALVGVITFTALFIVYVIQVLNMDLPSVLNAMYSGDPKALAEIIDTMSRDLLYNAITFIALLIASVIIALASTGYTKTILNVSRGGKPDLMDLAFPIKNNPDKIVILSLILFAITLIQELPGLIRTFTGGQAAGSVSDAVSEADPLAAADAVSAAGSVSSGDVVMLVVEIVLMIAVIAVNIYFSQASYLYLDDPEMPVKELITESVELMKGNVFRYILLNLSFIPWYILSMFTFGIGFVFVVPYHSMALVVFYRDLRGEYA